MIYFIFLTLKFISVKEMESFDIYSPNYVYRIKPKWTNNVTIEEIEVFCNNTKLWQTKTNYENGVYLSPYGDMAIGIRRDKIFVYTKEKNYSIPIKKFTQGHFCESIFIAKDMKKVLVINKNAFYEIPEIKDIFIHPSGLKVKLKDKSFLINEKELLLPEIYLRGVKISSKSIGMISPHNLYIYSKDGNLIIKKTFNDKLTSIELTDSIIFIAERYGNGAKLYTINYQGEFVDSITFTEKYSYVSHISYWNDTLRFVNNRKIYKYIFL